MAVFDYPLPTTRSGIFAISEARYRSKVEDAPRRTSSSKSPGIGLDKRVEKIIEMMRDDVRRELSLGCFAQAVNLSVWRLSHLFKSEVGMPPIKYLRLLRMERAKHLLETSFLSVKEIAFNVGLNDESHFVRDFKATYGLSPACYRAGFKSKHAEESNNSGVRTQAQDDIIRTLEQTILPSLPVFLALLF